MEDSAVTWDDPIKGVRHDDSDSSCRLEADQLVRSEKIIVLLHNERSNLLGRSATAGGCSGQWIPNSAQFRLLCHRSTSGSLFASPGNLL